MKNPNALILFIEYEPEKSANVLDLLYKIIDRCDKISWTLVRIDNRNSSLSLEEIPRVGHTEYRLGGNNSCHEFSGWDKGWKTIANHLPVEFNSVIITNDALLNSKPEIELLSVTNQLMEYISCGNAVCGWIDTYSRVSPKPIDMMFDTMKIFGNRVRYWLCTAFIIFPIDCFSECYPLTTFTRIEDVYNEKLSEGVFKEDCGLSKKFQEILCDHQSKKWIKKYELTEATYGRFKEKTRNIINESLLGNRISHCGKELLHLGVIYHYKINPRRKVAKILSFFLNNNPRIYYKILYFLSIKRIAGEIVSRAIKFYWSFWVEKKKIM